MEPPVTPSHHQKWPVPLQRKQGTKRIFDCAQSATLAWRHQPGMADFTQTSTAPHFPPCTKTTFRDSHAQSPTVSRLLSPGPGDVQTITTPLSHQPPLRRRLHRDSFARAQKIASPKLLPTVMPVLPRCTTSPLTMPSGADSAVSTLLTRAGSYVRYQQHPHERTGTPTGRGIACASLQKKPLNVMNLCALNDMANAARKVVSDVSKERHSSSWHHRTEFIQELVTCRLDSSLTSARAS